MPLPAQWRSRPAAVRRLYVVVWLSLLGLVWVTYAIARATVTDNLANELRLRLATDTLVLEDHASRSLGGVASRLEAVAALSSRYDLLSGRLAPSRLRDLVFDDTMVRSLSMVDPQGLIVTSSNAAMVGQQVSPAVSRMIGQAPSQPRRGVRFGHALAQRDLVESPGQGAAAASIWLAQTDLQSAEFAGYRWVLAINPGFFQNLWATVVRQTVTQVGLFDYDGKPVVTLGSGAVASPDTATALAQALQERDNGELAVASLPGWAIHYRASSSHPLIFVMFADRYSLQQQQLARTAPLWWSAWGGSLLVTVVVVLFFAGYLRYERSLRLNLELQRDAQTDALTGLANRRGFEAMAARDLARASAFGQPLSLVILDLDHFKSINDRFGHAAGDVVLKAMASRWSALLRSQDLIARIGGEEFCVLLPGAGVQQARAVALKLIEATRREPVAGLGEPVTVSAGVVGMERCSDGVSLESLMAVADGALYRAKEGGRDRVEVVSWPGG